jgi:penicillin-insensitive murein DD-endopeptidase
VTFRLVVGSWLVAVLLTMALGALAAGTGALRELPAKYQRSPYSTMSLSVGSPTSGWQVRAKRLRGSKALRIKNRERRYLYGHPALVLMVQRSAQQLIKQSPSSVLLVGDLSSEAGGPIPGHRSHQSGRDVDVGFFATDREGRSRELREFVAFDADGRARDGSGLVFDEYRNWLLVQLWLKDHRADISHVFVSTALRQRLLAFARARPAFRRYHDQAAVLLKQPQNSNAHDDHFHVRIACPAQQRSLCVEHAVVSD